MFRNVLIGICGVCCITASAADVTVCTLGELQAAIQTGGTIRFGCDATYSISTPLQVNQNVVLDANGHQVIFEGGGQSRLLIVGNGVRFEATKIQFQNGNYVGASAPAIPSFENFPTGEMGLGGAILNQGGVVSLTDCRFLGNQVAGGAANEYAHSGDGRGGAIASLGGSVQLTGCLFERNEAKGGLGVSSFNHIERGTGWGGALYFTNTAIQIVGSQFRNNLATYQSARGGAIAALQSSLLFDSCQFYTNSAFGARGEFGFGATVNAGEGWGGALYVENESGGPADSYIGCIWQGNQAIGGSGPRYSESGKSQGGAACVLSPSHFSHCFFSGNQSIAGWSLLPGAALGGGIYSTRGMVLNRCTVSGNTAQGGSATSEAVGGYGRPGSGGGVYAQDFLLATNSTIAGNFAAGGVSSFPQPFQGAGGYGGGLFIVDGSAHLVHVTIANNFLSGGSEGSLGTATLPTPTFGAGIWSSNAAVSIQNSIVGENRGTTKQVVGQVVDLGYNLTTDDQSGFGAATSRIVSNAKLDDLGDNGGPTPTLAPLLGSPARDAIPASANVVSVDQRGIARPQGSGTDIGALEANFIAAQPEIVVQPADQSVPSGTNVTFTVEAKGNELLFQWYFNNSAILGATDPSLLLSNVSEKDQGDYYVKVQNTVGSAQSRSAHLNVDSKPIIRMQPFDTQAYPLEDVAFEVVVEGDNLSYQWYHASDAIAGAHSPRLVIQEVQLSDLGPYFVVISNSAEQISSIPAVLSLNPNALKVSAGPPHSAGEVGDTITLTSTVTSIPNLPVQYQWWRGENLPLAGETNATFTIASASSADAGLYSLTVSNSFLGVRSDLVDVVVLNKSTQISYSATTKLVTILYPTRGLDPARLLVSPKVDGPWTAVATNAYFQAGNFKFIRPEPGTGQSFYRVVLP